MHDLLTFRASLTAMCDLLGILVGLRVSNGSKKRSNRKSEWSRVQKVSLISFSFYPLTSSLPCSRHEQRRLLGAMRTSKPKEDPLSHTLSTLDVPEILKLLCSYEIRRQISLDKAEEVWHPIGQRWIRVKKEDSVYLGKVRESAQDGAAFFSSVDLAWRRLVSLWS